MIERLKQNKLKIILQVLKRYYRGIHSLPRQASQILGEATHKSTKKTNANQSTAVENQLKPQRDAVPSEHRKNVTT